MICVIFDSFRLYLNVPASTRQLKMYLGTSSDAHEFFGDLRLANISSNG